MLANLVKRVGIAVLIVIPGAAATLVGRRTPAIQNFRVPMVEDWSSRHLVFSAPQSILQNLRLQQDPRYFQQYSWKNDGFRGPSSPPAHDPVSILREGAHQLQRDWGVQLAAGATMGDGNFPAKYSFTATTASCANDYVVFLTDLKGTTSTIVDIFALNNLYFSSSGSPLCASGPTVMWAYHVNTTSGGGPIGSPVISLDGSEVAWVEGGGGGGSAGTAAYLHILRPVSGQGTLAAPAPPGMETSTGSTYVTCKSGATSCDMDIEFFDAADDTESSPYYDYSGDQIFTGDDGTGTCGGSTNTCAYQFTNVFLGTPAQSTAGWPVEVHGGAQILTSPVYDAVSQNVYFGIEGLGEVRYVRVASTSSGACNTGVPPCRGANSLSIGGAMSDSPVIDSTTQELLAFATVGGTGAVVAQANMGGTTFGTTSKLTVGTGAGETFHSGTLDQAYFSSANGTGNLYVCAYNATEEPVIEWISMSAGILGAVESGSYVATSGASECSPPTEFYNEPNFPSTTGAVEYLFFSVLSANAADTAACGAAHSCVLSMQIGSGTSFTGPATPGAGLLESGGTSGIIVDNWSTSVGASSIYFTPLTNASSTYTCNGSATADGCAVKATQSGLN